MRLLTFLGAALIAAPALAGAIAVDGDTIKIDGETIRIVGLDTPETYRAKCAAERRHGTRAKDVLQELLNTLPYRVRRTGAKDRYGRTLAYVYIKDRDIAPLMVEHGLAMPYNCYNNRCPRRIDWCALLEN